MYITGRQFNGPNGKDVFFMKFNLDSLFVISGTQEHAIASSVSLYPNPVSQELSIDLQRSPDARVAAVQVFSIHGRMVRELRAPEGLMVRLPMQDLPEGLYIVAIHFEQGPPVTRKVLVVH
jgi:hypothetical protein